MTPPPLEGASGSFRTSDFTVICEGLGYPEGPTALADGSVLLVELAAGTLTRISPAGQREVVATLGGSPNGAAIGPDGQVYVCNSGGFTFLYVGKSGISPVPSPGAIALTDGSVAHVRRWIDSAGESAHGGSGDPLPRVHRHARRRHAHALRTGRSGVRYRRRLLVHRLGPFARPGARHHGRVLREGRRLADSRSDLSAQRAERHRAVARRPPALRRRDLHSPRARVGPRGPGSDRENRSRRSTTRTS